MNSPETGKWTPIRDNTIMGVGNRNVVDKVSMIDNINIEAI